MVIKQHKIMMMNNSDRLKADELLEHARTANVRGVRELLEHGVRPNVCDVNGNTPLHLSSAHPKGLECVKLLVSKGTL